MGRSGAAVNNRVNRSRPALRLLGWSLPFVFLAVFFFYPLATIFRWVIEAAGENALPPDTLPLVMRALSFTVWQAVLSTFFTLLIGLPAAFVFGKYRFRGKKFLGTLATIPFILPTVVAAAGFNALIGPRGWINLFLMGVLGVESPPLQIMNSLTAIVLAHVFYNTTIIIRTVGDAIERLDPRLEQAARVLGASNACTLREVTYPLLRPSIISATLLVFLFDFTSFGVVLLLGGPRYATLEVEIYIQALQMLNLPMAGVLSAVQLACTLLLTLLSNRLSGAAVILSPRVRGEGMRIPRRLWERTLVIVVQIVLVLLMAAPLGALALRSVTRFDANRGQRAAVQTGFTLDYYRELFINRRGSIFYVPPIDAARNSLIYAAATSALALTLGFLASSALMRQNRLRRVMEPLIMLPLGASAVTLGLGFILTFRGPPFDSTSFPVLVPIAHSLVALPFVVRVIQPALASIPASLRQAAAVMGASPLRVWREVDLPIAARAALVGAVFSFTISLGEFGASAFLASPEYPTLPVAIFRFLSQPGALNYGQALAMSTLLMLVCLAAILLAEKIQ